MAKPLFKNYSYQFDKNEKKLLTSFCKSMVKQMSSDERFYTDLKSFNSIIDKLNDSSEEVKLTKEEKTKLVFRLKENSDHLKKQLKNSWFLKRWLYKSVSVQYESLLQNHFQN
jgi:cell shape-determining protein MreC